MKKIIEEILDEVRNKIALHDSMDDDKAREIITDEVFNKKELKDEDLNSLSRICDKVFCKTRSNLGILKPLVDDPKISEIMVNGPEKIFIEIDGKVRKAPISFDTVSELEDIMQNIASQVHREINELNPIVDARLLDGSRVNGVYKNIAIEGPVLTIRKFSDDYMKIEDLERNGTINRKGIILLSALVSCGYNIFVSGGTSSGKTTLLNALSEFIPREERVIVIEDSTELKLNYIDNLVQMECRQGNTYGKGVVTMAQLIKSSLRMRPDRIIVGEVRGEEILDMLQAMNTGHAGSMSTGHGNSVQGMLRRLEAMYIMAMPLDINAVRSQIAEGIDIMVHIEKNKDKRQITEISEILGYSKSGFEINPLMEADEKGNLQMTGNTLKRQSKLKRQGGIYLDGLQNIGIVST